MSYYRTQALICKAVAPHESMKYLEINTFPGQRKLNQQKANQYAALMQSGEMRPVDIDVALCPGGLRYLMNGQHVCTGIVVYGKPYEARIQHWKCETETDAWHLFGTFDVHASRTEQQIIKAARPFLGELRDVPLSVLQACGSAIMMLTTDPPSFGTVKTIKTQKADMLLPHSEEVQWIASLSETAGKDRRGIFRVPSVAGMIATYRKNPDKADEFWRSVASGEMLRRGSAQWNLSNVLLSGVTEKNTLGGGTRNRVFYTYCIVYWNSWRSNTARRCVKFGAMKKVPCPTA